LLTTAAEPVDPSSPKFMILLEVGMFLGVILGVGTALMLEMNDKRLRQDEDLIRLLGVPVLGRIGAVKPAPHSIVGQEPPPGSLARI